MIIAEFITNSDDFSDWLKRYPDGWVYKINNNHKSKKLHRANCPHILKGTEIKGHEDLYIRACSEDRECLIRHVEARYPYKDEGDCGVCIKKSNS